MNYKKLIRIIITLSLIGVILWKFTTLGEIGAVFKRLDPFLTILILAAITLDRALMAFKWNYLLRIQDEKLPYARSLQIYCASAMYGLLLPTTLGPDVIRGYITSRVGLKFKTIVASIIVERMIGFLSSLLWGLAGLGILATVININEQLFIIGIAISFFLFLTIIAFSISFSENLFSLIFEKWLRRISKIKLVQQLRKLHEAYLAYKIKKRSLVIFFFLTVIEQLISFIIGWMIALALGIKVSILFVVGVIPLALLVSRIPISISGIGVLEGFFIFAFSLAGLTPAEAISMTFASRILQIIANIPWWFSHMLESNKFRLKIPNHLE